MNPLFCIKCWEEYKRQQQADMLPDVFGSLTREEKALRMGVVVPNGSHASTVTRHINNRVDHVSRYVSNDVLDTLQQNSPRPFPTLRPMSADAREKLARQGRVFNISMLCFDTKQCDCCGCVIPLHDDPQLDKLASSKEHSFR
jgi:hypothetical protein